MRRYFLELAGCLALYAVVLAASLTVLGQGGQADGPRVLISLAPMIPAFLLCWVIVRGVRRMDELQRRVQFEAIVFAFAGSALSTFGYGFLENAGLPRLSMFAVWPLMAVLWVVGAALAARRYR
ncbi:hypothetical protein FOZ76_15725 [Verticiella sediminum]|uniref:Uncharacterized protein n=1 Tax=Verticiella sediminum TaxID=1247510 RepID=A0A556AJ05_9BURK|nr:hypothetical protein [Verticiella sediminum]TSH92845.1 hypothetical protein FOZ76_15725 [Verticiella sediminum]